MAACHFPWFAGMITKVSFWFQQEIIIGGCILSIPGTVHVIVFAADSHYIPRMRSSIAGTADNPNRQSCFLAQSVEKHSIPLTDSFSGA